MKLHFWSLLDLKLSLYELICLFLHTFVADNVDFFKKNMKPVYAIAVLKHTEQCLAANQKEPCGL